jgi:hypothetical protein
MQSNSMSAAPVLRAALKLPPRSRARLAGQLLSSIENETQKRIDRLWAREAEARIDAFDAGSMKSVPATVVLRSPVKNKPQEAGFTEGRRGTEHESVDAVASIHGLGSAMI